MNLFRRGTHRRTPETWARMQADLDAKDARIEALQRRVSQLDNSDALVVRLVAERDAFALRVHVLERQVACDATVTREMPIPGMAQPTPIKASNARFQTADFMQGAHAARGAA